MMTFSGNVDFRYENTLRLSFDEEVYEEDDDGVTDKGEEQLDYINNILHVLLKDTNEHSQEIEIDWRDNCEVEIHGISKRKFYKKYDETFIELISEQYG